MRAAHSQTSIAYVQDPHVLLPDSYDHATELGITMLSECLVLLCCLASHHMTDVFLRLMFSRLPPAFSMEVSQHYPSIRFVSPLFTFRSLRLLKLAGACAFSRWRGRVRLCSFGS